MKMELPEVRPEERTPLVESLLAIIRQLLDRVEQLEETVQQVRDENALLKGQKPRPKISPSRLGRNRSSATQPRRSKRRQRQGRGEDKGGSLRVRCAAPGKPPNNLQSTRCAGPAW